MVMEELIALLIRQPKCLELISIIDPEQDDLEYLLNCLKSDNKDIRQLSLDLIRKISASCAWKHDGFLMNIKSDNEGICRAVEILSSKSSRYARGLRGVR